MSTFVAFLGICSDEPVYTSPKKCTAVADDARTIYRRQEKSNVTYDEYNAFCASLPASSHIVQWGGSHVWKVGPKVFAIGGWEKDQPAITFKVSEASFEILKQQPGLRPAPYLASRGMSWIQHYAEPGLSDGELKDYIRRSHQIVASGLSKKARRELLLD